MNLEFSSDIELTKLKSIAFDTSTISRGTLDIENKDRSNLLPWKGQFSPQLVESLLKSYSSPGDMVLDPFMGSGTVLYECDLLGLNSIGIELNPAAVKMAQIYLMSRISTEDRKKYINTIEKRISPFIAGNLPLFQKSNETLGSFELFQQILECFSNKLSEEAKLIFETYLILIDPKEKELTQSRAQTLWRRLASLILNLPEANSSMKVFNGDCRSTPLRKNSIDLVITSPPYINVFNYHQQKRTPIEAMGWDVLSVARSEIGSNRKHRGNRYLTVTQYCLDMFKVFEELQRICKPKTKIIFVVGRESNVRKTSFFNSEIIASIVEQCLGFTVKGRHERAFKNRFGQFIKEDLLLIENPDSLLEDGLDPRKVAHRVLVGARKRAPKESKGDLTNAIAAVEDVMPSPAYESQAIHPRISDLISITGRA